MKFLGRTFNPNTMTYSFLDGSGTVPEEMRQDVINSIATRGGGAALFELFDWKDRLESTSSTIEGKKV